MASVRSKRRIVRLLGKAEEAVSQLDRERVRNRAQAVLAFEPDNGDATDLLIAVERATVSGAIAVPPLTPKHA